MISSGKLNDTVPEDGVDMVAAQPNAGLPSTTHNSEDSHSTIVCQDTWAKVSDGVNAMYATTDQNGTGSFIINVKEKGQTNELCLSTGTLSKDLTKTLVYESDKHGESQSSEVEKRRAADIFDDSVANELMNYLDNSLPRMCEEEPGHNHEIKCPLLLPEELPFDDSLAEFDPASRTPEEYDLERNSRSTQCDNRRMNTPTPYEILRKSRTKQCDDVTIPFESNSGRRNKTSQQRIEEKIILIQHDLDINTTLRQCDSTKSFIQAQCDQKRNSILDRCNLERNVTGPVQCDSKSKSTPVLDDLEKSSNPPHLSPERRNTPDHCDLERQSTSDQHIRETTTQDDVAEVCEDSVIPSLSIQSKCEKDGKSVMLIDDDSEEETDYLSTSDLSEDMSDVPVEKHGTKRPGTPISVQTLRSETLCGSPQQTMETDLKKKRTDGESTSSLLPDNDNLEDELMAAESYMYKPRKRKSNLKSALDPFTCVACNLTFLTEIDLQIHQNYEACDGLYQCVVCGDKFASIDNLRFHGKVHNVFFCSACARCYKTKAGLIKHKFDHTGLKPYSCSKCNTSYKTRRELVIHERYHTGKMPFRCGKCANGYTTQTQLNRHLSSHVDDRKLFSCKMCRKVFQKRSSLILHQAIHKENVVYACGMCGNDFSSKQLLESHEQLHKDMMEGLDHSPSFPLQKSSCSLIPEPEKESDYCQSRTQLSPCGQSCDQFQILSSSLNQPSNPEQVYLESPISQSGRAQNNKCEQENLDNLSSPVSQSGRFQNNKRDQEYLESPISSSGRFQNNKHEQENLYNLTSLISPRFQNTKCEQENSNNLSSPVSQSGIFQNNKRDQEYLESPISSSGRFHNNKREQLYLESPISPSYRSQTASRSQSPFISQLPEPEHDASCKCSRCEDISSFADKPTYRYECSQCGKISRSQMTFLYHKLVHNSIRKPFKCDFCSMEFHLETSLTSHKLLHREPSLNTCDQCGKGMDSKLSLLYHKRKYHTARRTYKCDKCENVFKSTWHLDRHVVTHLDSANVFSCHVCNKKFKTSSGLARHQIDHTGERRHSCPVCNKKFKTKTELIRHDAIHSGIRPYCCETCRKCFALKSELTSHSQMHMRRSRRNFDCDKCGQTFKTDRSLRHHLRDHDDWENVW